MSIEDFKSNNPDQSEKIDFSDPNTSEKLDRLKDDVLNLKDGIESSDTISDTKTEVLGLLNNLLDAIESQDQVELLNSINSLSSREDIELGETINSFSNDLDNLQNSILWENTDISELSQEEISRLANEWKKNVAESVADEVDDISEELKSKWPISRFFAWILDRANRW